MKTINYDPQSLSYTVGVVLKPEGYDKVLTITDINRLQEIQDKPAITPEQFDHLYEQDLPTLERTLSDMICSYHHDTGRNFIRTLSF